DQLRLLVHATDLEHAAAIAAALAGSGAGALARPNAATGAAADTAAGTSSVGSDTELGERIAKVRRLNVGGRGVGDDGRLHDQLRFFVLNHRHWRNELLVGNPWQ